MATHQLAIAKASFSACLLRPDPTSVSRDEIANFHNLTNLVVSHCSPKNIQKCKNWIFYNITHSSLRLAAVGKYFVALSGSFTRPETLLAVTVQRGPSAKRRCLHLLYLVNDLLHHAKVRSQDVTVAAALQPFLISLMGNATSFRKSPKHYRKIEELLGIWEEKQYYLANFFEKLREAVKGAREATESIATPEHSDQINEARSGQKLPKILSFMLPSMHGDQSTPWYDLPAGNLMSQIIPNSTRPINPNLVKPLRLAPGPATEELVTAVSQLLQNATKLFEVTKLTNQNEVNSWDIDELGQPIFRIEPAGEHLNVEAYYGWSKEFCDKMKTRPHRPGTEKYSKVRGKGRSRSRSRSRSQSSIQNDQGIKRRRHSISEEGRSRSRSSSVSRRSWRRYSSSRSPPGDRNDSSGQYNNSHVPPRLNSKPGSQERIDHTQPEPIHAYEVT